MLFLQVQCSTVQFNTIPYNAMQCNTVDFILTCDSDKTNDPVALYKMMRRKMSTECFNVNVTFLFIYFSYSSQTWNHWGDEPKSTGHKQQEGQLC